MSTLAEIEAQIAELEEANENLHDSLDAAEAMDDAEAIEFFGSLDERDEAIEAWEAAIQSNLEQIAELEG
ncbi:MULTISPECIES: hypothetical protein [Ralstonia solanacearum species complex]|uniref:Uncharacterized protein n=3 Tax=root TaxID=1 RepID=A0A1W5LU18_9VIRU|nr:hypothetical protein [Ralstonia solanacearum]YP_009786098.1 hypothetical protein [Ralstonia phage Rs551]YP_010083973.1 hypothetical protein KMD52_gp05 [Ralstonia phage RSIBR3]ALF87515.1 hypothetical protein RSUY_11460 [Ralstonia solanacearum]ANO57660.1 hypothetical protein [Ralstonia phage Rs551]ATI27033.1 hypothetical protein CCY86_05715 [Ralstonia solanacearum]ATW64828.1 hypothetical protein RSIBR1_gp05 [Ralstonia phage RSIBR3]EAP73621.1 Hypothetical Protein RRSL_03346 [Ralstonia solana